MARRMERRAGSRQPVLPRAMASANCTAGCIWRESCDHRLVCGVSCPSQAWESCCRLSAQPPGWAGPASPYIIGNIHLTQPRQQVRPSHGVSATHPEPQFQEMYLVFV